MSQTVKNVNYALVGKDVVGATITAGISDLADGQLGVFNSGGTAGAIVAGQKFVIALGGPNNKAKFVSELIDPAEVDLATRTTTVAATQASQAYGFNGTNGSIDTSFLAGNLYFADIYIQEMLRSSTDGRTVKHFQYQTIADGDTQADIASGLLKSAINNFSREAEDYMGFEMLCDDAGAAMGAVADTVVGVKGTKTVVVTETTAVATVAPGDYFRIGTAVTDPVYKVTASTVTGTSGTLTLDVPLQESFSLLGTTTEFITAALADAGNCGITMTGKTLDWTLGKGHYSVLRFESIMRDAGTTTFTQLSDAFDGRGVYKQAADAEWFTRGFEGEYNREGFSDLYQSVFNAADGNTYDVTSIRFKDSSLVGFKNEISPKQITMWSVTSADYMDNAAAQSGVWPQLKLAIAAAKLSKIVMTAPGNTAITPDTLDV